MHSKKKLKKQLQTNHVCFVPFPENLSIEIKKMLLKLFIYKKKKRHFAVPLIENKTFFVQKIRGFVDSKFRISNS